jgi:hypothetical protein
MNARILRRSEEIARSAQQRRIREVAAYLGVVLGSASIEVEEARVLVRGRGIVKRWLIDPSLRFLSGGLK